ncbi:MAG: hypothetical protein AAB074_05610 [Planctomycetota bacterium]
MAKVNAEEVKKDVVAQKKTVVELKAKSKDRDKDTNLRAERKRLKRLQRRWRLASGTKIAAAKKAAEKK